MVFLYKSIFGFEIYTAYLKKVNFQPFCDLRRHAHSAHAVWKQNWGAYSDLDPFDVKLLLREVYLITETLRELKSCIFAKLMELVVAKITLFETCFSVCPLGVPLVLCRQNTAPTCCFIYSLFFIDYRRVALSRHLCMYATRVHSSLRFSGSTPSHKHTGRCWNNRV